MRHIVLHVGRVTPWLTVVVVGLLTSSAGAQTVQRLDLPSEAPKALQQPPKEETVEDAGTARGQRWGYVFAGPGLYRDETTISTGPGSDFFVSRHTKRSIHLGGGVEWQLFKSWGITVETGVVAVDGYPHGTLSGNVSYRLRSAQPGRLSLVPFVTGGFSAVDAPGVNLGVGADYWFRGRGGLRFEVRATRLRDEPLQRGFVPHPSFLEFRIGINFGRSPGSTNRPGSASSRR